MDAKLYTVKEVSQIIYCNTNYVYELIRKVFLPAMKLGNYKIRAEALDKFLSESEGKDLTDLDDVKDITLNAEIKEVKKWRKSPV